MSNLASRWEMSDQETDDAIIEAEITIKAHRLGEFIRAPENRDKLNQLCKILNEETMSFTWDNLTLLEQGASGKILYGIVRNPNEDLLADLRYAFALGCILGAGKDGER